MESVHGGSRSVKLWSIRITCIGLANTWFGPFGPCLRCLHSPQCRFFVLFQGSSDVSRKEKYRFTSSKFIPGFILCSSSSISFFFLFSSAIFSAFFWRYFSTSFSLAFFSARRSSSLSFSARSAFFLARSASIAYSKSHKKTHSEIHGPLSPSWSEEFWFSLVRSEFVIRYGPSLVDEFLDWPTRCNVNSILIRLK